VRLLVPQPLTVNKLHDSLRLGLHIGVDSCMAPCVLVVDDDHPIQCIVADILGEVGCEVLLASNGTEALGHMRRRAPDVVVTDLNMPGLDGVSLVKVCRNEPKLRHIPIVVMTAEASYNEQSLTALGVQNIVAKPFDVHLLVSIITSIIAA